MTRFEMVLGTAFALAMTGCASTGGVDAKANIATDKVVYHINDTEGQATRAMQYISNHLEVNPKARIVIVTHASGVDFLMRDAKTKNGNPYSIPVEELALQGVRFEVCEITRLQQREGYAYLRP